MAGGTRVRLRLVYVSSGLGVGGAETSLLNLLQHLDRERFEPQVVSLRDRGVVGERIAALGVPVHAVGLFGAGSLLPGFWRLVRLLRRLRPALMQTWMYHGDLFGSLAGRLAGAPPLAWGIRNSTLVPGQSRRGTVVVARACARLSRSLPQRIVSCSEVARDVHVALGYAAERFVVIPNGFDLGSFRPDPAARAEVRRELGLAADVPLVAMVGRFDPQKNHLGFLRSAAQLHVKRPDVHYVLAGLGLTDRSDTLAQAIAGHGLQDVVHLLGLRDDTPRLMAGSDLLALPSAYGEAFPRVVGEAMACGTPCVVTDVGDSGRIVGDTGLCVAPGDDAAFARALDALLELPPDRRRELGARARRRVEELYDIRAVTRRYEDLYLEMAGAARCAG